MNFSPYKLNPYRRSQGNRQESAGRAESRRAWGPHGKADSRRALRKPQGVAWGNGGILAETMMGSERENLWLAELEQQNYTVRSLFRFAAAPI